MSETATIEIAPASAGHGGLDNGWRGLIALTADFVFETDLWGRFTHITTMPGLAWPEDALLGQSAAALLAGSPDASCSDDRRMNPFRPTCPLRGARAWIRRGDGGVVCLSFTAAPIVDSDGRILGARGFATDLAEGGPRIARVAAGARRADVLDHVLRGVGREVLAPRMIAAALETLVRSMGARGAAIVAVPPDTPPFVAHRAGDDADQVPPVASTQAYDLPAAATSSVTADKRPLLTAGCAPRFGDPAVLLIWRQAGAPGWDADDQRLIGSAANIVRMVYEHEAIRRDLASRARHDPLTGLLNRAAFLEDIERHIIRLEQEAAPGTLLIAGVDYLGMVNQRLGHEAGDGVLTQAASLLRQILRPTDLIGRFEGDQFGIWMSGADRLTAAERADALRERAHGAFAALLGTEGPKVGLSIGIAARRPGTDEDLDGLVTRTGQALEAAKHGGRGQWRVSLRDGD
jgi:diguanylate cyclase (GGDEF)-like protein